MVINDGQTGALSKKLYHTITSIQNGNEPDPFEWTVEVKPQLLKTVPYLFIV